MKRWLLVPLALCSLVLIAPSSEGSGLFRKKSCDSGSGCGQTIVGYETQVRTVTVPEWVVEKRKVNVTEYRTVTEKAKVTKYKSDRIEEKKPVTIHFTENVKKTRTEKYWVCEPITTEETREYTVYTEVKTEKKGKRKVCKPITTEEERKVTVDEGHYETQCVEQTVSNSCGKSRRGLCRKSCDSGCDTGCSTVLVSKKVWISKPVTKTEKVKVTKYQDVEEDYTYWEISHKPEKKSEKVKVTKFQNVEKSREVTYWVCESKTRVEERTFVSYKTSSYIEEVDVKVCRPITVEKEIDVKVCRHVTKNVEVKVPVYGTVANSGCASDCAPAKKCCK